MRVCSKDYDYSFKAPQGGWWNSSKVQMSIAGSMVAANETEIAKWGEYATRATACFQAVAKQYDWANAYVRGRLDHLVNLDVITPQQASYMHWHLVNMRVAKALGCDYTRRVRGESERSRSDRDAEQKLADYEEKKKIENAKSWESPNE
jgi:hypothetical protein